MAGPGPAKGYKGCAILCCTPVWLQQKAEPCSSGMALRDPVVCGVQLGLAAGVVLVRHFLPPARKFKSAQLRIGSHAVLNIATTLRAKPSSTSSTPVKPP